MAKKQVASYIGRNRLFGIRLNGTPTPDARHARASIAREELEDRCQARSVKCQAVRVNLQNNIRSAAQKALRAAQHLVLKSFDVDFYRVERAESSIQFVDRKGCHFEHVISFADGRIGLPGYF